MKNFFSQFRLENIQTPLFRPPWFHFWHFWAEKNWFNPSKSRLKSENWNFYTVKPENKNLYFCTYDLEQGGYPPIFDPSELENEKKFQEKRPGFEILAFINPSHERPCSNLDLVAGLASWHLERPSWCQSTQNFTLSPNSPTKIGFGLKLQLLKIHMKSRNCTFSRNCNITNYFEAPWLENGCLHNILWFRPFSGS